LTGVESNETAFRALETIEGVRAVRSSLADFNPSGRFDLVFTCGLLIHIAPEDLGAVYAKLASLSSSYLLLNEYFSPQPAEIDYRGHAGRLFKRDFAGEFLDSQPEFVSIAYGFLWKRLEPAWDNSNWTLLRRNDRSPRYAIPQSAPLANSARSGFVR
jgi:pseudaminic acid biosynthesis-associated methylase